MFKIELFRLVVLLCPSGMPLGECDTTNAVDVMRKADRYKTPFACLDAGQQTLAQTVLADGRVRAKITCPRIASAP